MEIIQGLFLIAMEATGRYHSCKTAAQAFTGSLYLNLNHKGTETQRKDFFYLPLCLCAFVVKVF
ncbi:hypothetical protein [Salinisphaera sp. G21_0]|uniref:hypothetical protein n=1 Tax=Salinisphaera sp. G21_0 TaxID=2821094 RepID=UPI001ADD0D32|nr:hypothetical protein [Salinisphaera sp. G21_0]MBO9484610.1 hypothetical protein [Salinisphaera sp. G21_0]